MGFKCGIVGLPNVGKSTVFNALTAMRVAAANYPFCTIEPNAGIVSVSDFRLDKLAAIVKPQKIVPTTVEFVDIAGLVAGAAKGEGLGNKFLSHIREAEAVVHVVRCFNHSDVIHVANCINPLADIETIHTELALSDLETIERTEQRLNKSTKKTTTDKTMQLLLPLLKHLTTCLNKGTPIRCLNLNEEEKNLIKPLQLLTAKPMLYLANVDEDGFQNNALLKQVENLAQNEKSQVISLCAKLEESLIEMKTEEKLSFLEILNLHDTGLNRLIRAGYDLLGLQTYFTAGIQEVRAWTIPQGATAPEAAGVIHTDFEKGFIRAEVIAYDDFIQYAGEQGAKEAGKRRLEGKNYIVQDGDVIHFLFSR